VQPSIRILRLLAIICSLAALTPTGFAQTHELVNATDFYGRGAEAYFTGHPADVETYLSTAMALDPNDPRSFYFRGLSRLRSGNYYEACDDFEIGAQLEAESPNRYGVGTALIRIQGCDRLLLEKYRQQARATMGPTRDVRPTASTSTYVDPYADRDAAVLREQVVVPLDELLSPQTPRALTPEELKQRAAAAKARAATQVPAKPGAAPAAPPADPFADDAAASTDSAPAVTPPQPEDTEPAEVEAPAETPASEDSAPPAESTPSEAEEDPFSDL